MSTVRLPLLAALFVLAAATPSPAMAAGTPASAGPTAPGSDTLLARHRTYYDLYAPTETQLDGTARAVQFALEQYGRHIGERTERVVFVTFASDAECARYDVKPVRRHELPIVEYVGSVNDDPQRSKDIAITDAQKRIPRSLHHQAGHAFLYEFVQAQLRKRGQPVDSTLLRSTGDAARGADLHRLHSRIPDWFDEAVAALCETPVNRGIRLRAMGQSLDRRIPFTEFFAMRMPLNSPERAALFSNQAFTVASFIASAEGDRFLGHIAVGLIEGRFIGQCLLDATTLYSKPEALEQQYVAWVRAQTGAAPAK